LHPDRRSWSCAQLASPLAAFSLSLAGWTCLYCGAEFPITSEGQIRIDHLSHDHKFRECDLAKRFFRREHFRQHLKHAHAASLDVQRIDMLDRACSRFEVRPEYRTPVPPVRELATSGLSGPPVERLELPEADFGCPIDAVSPDDDIQDSLAPTSGADEPQWQLDRIQNKSEASQSKHHSVPKEVSPPHYPQAGIVQGPPGDDDPAFAIQVLTSKLLAEATKPQKSFVCQICQQSFTRRTSLVNHRRTHTGEKPYSCTIPGCDRKFAQQGDKTRHEKAQHSEKTFICGSTSAEGVSWGCGKAFRRRDGLLEHHRETAKGKGCFEERERIGDSQGIGVDDLPIVE
jgi:hypothetical protein